MRARDAVYIASDATRLNAIAPFSNSFFKPFNTPLDFGRRLLTIISAPMALSLLAVEQLLEFLLLGLKNMIYFASNEKSDFQKPIDAICSSLKLLLMAVVSPLLNTVDVIGSTVSTGLGVA